MKIKVKTINKINLENQTEITQDDEYKIEKSYALKLK